MHDEVIRVSRIILQLSDDRTQASLKCTSPEQENDFVLMMKIEMLEPLRIAATHAMKGRSSMLEQLKMAAIRGTKGHSREPELDVPDE